ncbi:MAG: 6-phosphofructokinase [Candidatus Omnitrophica bacterium]|nr:6-phosphofructokinase [Candidatus Omnitrophota bacterium]
MTAVKRIGVLTGGGDCPGLNPVIRAVVRRAAAEGIEVLGFMNGWKGLVENKTTLLDLNAVSGIVHRGGTILGTSRTNPYKKPENIEKLRANFKFLNLDALIAIGGEDTLGVATKLVAEGYRVVGVPKTIDNDLSGTDYTFGFDTAVNIATEAIDRLHTTAESHHRIMVVEVMGRHAGWIAMHSGLAGGADVILIPEFRIDVDEVCTAIQKRHARGKLFSIVVVAEGAEFKPEGGGAASGGGSHDSEITSGAASGGGSHKPGQVVSQAQGKLDEFGHLRLGGVGQAIAQMIEERTGYETRVTVLGHIQRGGTPTAYDRVLGTRFGVKAVELVLKGEFGKMVSLQGTEIAAVPIAEATGKLKTVDAKFYQLAKVFFG